MSEGYIYIITATIGRKDLTKCVESVREQNYEREGIRHIVVNDGAGKSTIPAGIRKKVYRVIDKEEKTGPGAARNTGIISAFNTGGCDRICFLDDDDFYFPDAVGLLVENLSDFDMVYGDLDFKEWDLKDGELTIKEEKHNFSKDWGGWGSMQDKPYIPLPAAMFNADFFTKYGIFREDIGRCIPAGTEVMTETGMAPIEEVLVGTRVPTGMGSNQEVLKLFNNGISNDVREIHLKGRDKICATGGHRFLCATTQYGRGSKDASPEISWKEVRHLTDKDLLLSLIPEACVDVEGFNVNYDFATCPGVKIKSIPITSDFLEVCGWYLSEGCLDYGKVVFCLNKSESGVAEFIKVTLEDLFGIRVSIQPDPRSHSLKVVAYSVILEGWFRRSFGEYCDHKYLPNWALTLPYEKQKRLLRGIWRGDGHRDTRVPRATLGMTSRKLIIGVRTILARLGVYVPTVYMQWLRGPKVRKPVYTIYLYQEHNDFIRALWNGDYSFEMEAPRLRSHQPIIVDGKKYIGTRVDRVVHHALSLPVFDLMIAKEHSYTIPYATAHNCVDWELLARGEAAGAKYRHIQYVVGEAKWIWGEGTDNISTVQDPRKNFPPTTWGRIKTIISGHYL